MLCVKPNFFIFSEKNKATVTRNSLALSLNPTKQANLETFRPTPYLAWASKCLGSKIDDMRDDSILKHIKYEYDIIFLRYMHISLSYYVWSSYT